MRVNLPDFFKTGRFGKIQIGMSPDDILAICGQTDCWSHFSRKNKLYWEDSTHGNSNKPLHLIYADAAASGDPSVVEINDWEESQVAREVHFLWPDAIPLNQYSEAGL